MNRMLMLIAVLPATFIVSCSRDKELIDTTSPAYYIAESEKLLIPAAIDLPPAPNGNTRIATYYAEGVQKYKAQPKTGSTPITYEWAFVGPQADLYDATNKKIGTHGAGPFWQLSATDSIFAQPFTPAKNSPGDAPQTIDWLLLMTRQGKTPTGVFADVTYIQRIATKGGKAPVNPPTTATETADVSYTAIYRFTRRNP